MFENPIYYIYTEHHGPPSPRCRRPCSQQDIMSISVALCCWFSHWIN